MIFETGDSLCRLRRSGESMDEDIKPLRLIRRMLIG